VANSSGETSSRWFEPDFHYHTKPVEYAPRRGRYALRTADIISLSAVLSAVLF
jgi:hypothetical protein